ncbi:MAG: tetratricopeptide repeat protein [Thermosynechococcaceae cyanobacterium]
MKNVSKAIAIAGNRVQQGHETPLRAPYPLVKSSKFSQRLAASGCTEKFPHQVYKEKGDEYYEAKQWSSAIAEYSKAVSLSPRYTAVFYNRGLAYHYNGQKTQAIADIDRAARLFKEQGKTKDSRDAIDFIRRIDPNYQIVKTAKQNSAITNTTSTLSSLPNANYRFCEKRYVKTFSQVHEDTGYCFSFRKSGDRVVGDFYYPQSDSIFCFSGKFSNNKVAGETYHIFSDSQERNFSYEAKGKFYIQRNPTIIIEKVLKSGPYSQHVGIAKYQQTSIFLSNMYQWNSGQYIPPKTCPTSLT